MSEPSVREIVSAVADFYGVSVRDIVSDRRTAGIVRPRHVAMYIALRATGKSLKRVGRGFGGRDHTSVRNARQSIEAAVEADADLRDEVAAIEAAVMAAHRLPDWIKVAKRPDLDPEVIAARILDVVDEIEAITVDELIALAGAYRAAAAAPDAVGEGVDAPKERPLIDRWREANGIKPPPPSPIALAASALLEALTAADSATFGNRHGVELARVRVQKARAALADALNASIPNPTTKEAVR